MLQTAFALMALAQRTPVGPLGPFDTLLVDGFDLEQIWEEIRTFNEALFKIADQFKAELSHDAEISDDMEDQLIDVENGGDLEDESGKDEDGGNELHDNEEEEDFADSVDGYGEDEDDLEDGDDHSHDDWDGVEEQDEGKEDEEEEASDLEELEGDDDAELAAGPSKSSNKYVRVYHHNSVLTCL